MRRAPRTRGASLVRPGARAVARRRSALLRRSHWRGTRPAAKGRAGRSSGTCRFGAARAGRGWRGSVSPGASPSARGHGRCRRARWSGSPPMGGRCPRRGARWPWARLVALWRSRRHAEAASPDTHVHVDQLARGFAVRGGQRWSEWVRWCRPCGIGTLRARVPRQHQVPVARACDAAARQGPRRWPCQDRRVPRETGLCLPARRTHVSATDESPPAPTRIGARGSAVGSRSAALTVHARRRRCPWAARRAARGWRLRRGRGTGSGRLASGARGMPCGWRRARVSTAADGGGWRGSGDAGGAIGGLVRDAPRLGTGATESGRCAGGEPRRPRAVGRHRGRSRRDREVRGPPAGAADGAHENSTAADATHDAQDRSASYARGPWLWPRPRVRAGLAKVGARRRSTWNHILAGAVMRCPARLATSGDPPRVQGRTSGARGKLNRAWIGGVFHVKRVGEGRDRNGSLPRRAPRPGTGRAGAHAAAAGVARR